MGGEGGSGESGNNGFQKIMQQNNNNNNNNNNNKGPERVLLAFKNVQIRIQGQQLAEKTLKTDELVLKVRVSLEKI